jgi:hypothetical protein
MSDCIAPSVERSSRTPGRALRLSPRRMAQCKLGLIHHGLNLDWIDPSEKSWILHEGKCVGLYRVQNDSYYLLLLNGVHKTAEPDCAANDFDEFKFGQGSQ